MRKLWRRGLCLTLLVSASVTQGAEMGLLVMNVRGVAITNTNAVQNGFPLLAYTLRNLETREVVKNSSPGRAWAVEVREGIYCLDSVTFAGNVLVDYCGEPYFKVQQGAVNNAGRWMFGVMDNFQRSKLIYAARDPDATLDGARLYNDELFAKYRQRSTQAPDAVGSGVGR
jgi:hypothetical protein